MSYQALGFEWVAHDAASRQVGYMEHQMAHQLQRSERNRDVRRILLRLIQLLQDKQHGLAAVGENFTDPDLKRAILAESLQRARLRTELENELLLAGMIDVEALSVMPAGISVLSPEAGVE